jgi:hypothetical protein
MHGGCVERYIVVIDCMMKRNFERIRLDGSPMVELLGVVVERKLVRLRNLCLPIRDLSFSCPFPVFLQG